MTEMGRFVKFNGLVKQISLLLPTYLSCCLLQQFHDALSCKARRAVRSASQPSQEEDPKQRLEAKLVAAKQKRYSKEANRHSILFDSI
jgi:hypothetical protein